MKFNFLFVLIAAMLFLAGCSDNPAKEFVKTCDASKQECQCMADYLDSRLSKKEFKDLNKILSTQDESKARQMFLGGGISENTTEALFASAKLCDVS